MKVPVAGGVRVAAHVWRRLRQRPRTSVSCGVAFAVALGYFILWRMHHSNLGRWPFNYGNAVLDPWYAYFGPPGPWGPIGNAPRWVQEINDAPWMGDWPLAPLSRPGYQAEQLPGASDAHARLASPSLVKLHVFSTVSEKSRLKRAVIRRLSPLRTVPPAYRHLVEIKFVLGHAFNADWSVDEDMEALLAQEQQEHGDLLRLSLVYGENLREGKILDWIHAVGAGDDGGRESRWLFKVDDDTVLNLPVFLDTLLTLDPRTPTYLGTSLARWPSYHHHFTGLLTGFNWGLVKTLAYGIGNMTRQEIEASWDDDVLTGELMTCLPSAPHCRHTPGAPPLPAYCDPHRPPPHGYLAPPPRLDPRTGLLRYDFLRRMGEVKLWWLKNDVASHGWDLKSPAGYEKEWNKKVRGAMWTPPKWLEPYADRAV